MSFRKSDNELIEQLCELRHHIQEYHWNQLLLYSSVFLGSVLPQYTVLCVRVCVCNQPIFL